MSDAVFAFEKAAAAIRKRDDCLHTEAMQRARKEHPDLFKAISWKHDDLARDLGKHLVKRTGRRAYFDMQLGPAGSPRPDVFTICHSYQAPEPLAYECKVSRSDFLRDTGSGKWRSYLKFSVGVVFAVPKGLVALDEIPADAGLIVRSANVWRMAKRPRVQSVTIPQSALLKIAFDSDHKRVGGGIPEPRQLNYWKLADGLRKDLGETVATIVGDTVGAKDMLKVMRGKIKEARETERAIKAKACEIEADAMERGRAEFAKHRAILCDALGIPSGTSQWSLNARIAEAAARLSLDGEVTHLRLQIEAIEQALAAAQPVREIEGE